MASAKKRISTYHVVPRFDIAANGGPLMLGTVVGDLQKLKPLNRGKDHIAIPEHIKPYTPVLQTGFRETRASLRSGQFEAWAKALGQGLGGSATVGNRRNDEEVVSCKKVVTTYFDPDHGYVAQSLATKGVQNHFVGSGYEADVFLVTGLKVAKKLSFSENWSNEAEREVEVTAEPPQVPAEVGVSGRLAASTAHTVQFDVDDIVVGFRVTRYRYLPASIFPWKKEKKLVEEDYLEGAEMYDDKQEEQEQLEFHFEEIPIAEEIRAQEKAATAGIEDECWVDPSTDD